MPYATAEIGGSDCQNWKIEQRTETQNLPGESRELCVLTAINQSHDKPPRIHRSASRSVNAVSSCCHGNSCLACTHYRCRLACSLLRTSKSICTIHLSNGSIANQTTTKVWFYLGRGYMVDEKPLSATETVFREGMDLAYERLQGLCEHKHGGGCIHAALWGPLFSFHS